MMIWVIYVRIVDTELNISHIIDIKKGTIPMGESSRINRHCDCFAYIICGRAIYHFRGSSYLAEPGDVIYLGRGTSYDITVLEPDYRFCFADFLFACDNNRYNEVFKGEGLKKLENVFIKFHALWTAGNFSDKIYCKSLLYRIYSDIVRENALQYIPSAKKARIDLALEEIRNNYTNPELSVEKLCSDCSMSEVHFRRLFFQIYHTSPIKFIISLRINKAKDLLSNTDMRIQCISDQCGFNNPYYFSKVFKQQVGLTPSDYRLQSKIKY